MAKMIPLIYFEDKNIVDPDKIIRIVKIKGWIWCEGYHNRFWQNTFRDLKGLSNKKKCRIKSQYIKPKIRIYFSDNSKYTLINTSYNQQERLFKEIVNWVNKHKSNTECKFKPEKPQN